MKILICIDDSESAEMILSGAVEFIEGFPEAEVQIFTVIDMAVIAAGNDFDETLAIDNQEHQANQLLGRATAVLGSRSFIFSHEVGSPAAEIVDKINTTHCELLIMGTHGRKGFNHFLTGSVVERVLRQVTCSTLIIPIRKENQDS